MSSFQLIKRNNLTFVIEEILTKQTNDESIMDTSSFNRYLTREIKSNIIENKLDDYVNNKRNEIYARMKLPKVLVNHYVMSANQSNMSVDQLPHDLFDSQNLNASKCKFEEEQCRPYLKTV